MTEGSDTMFKRKMANALVEAAKMADDVDKPELRESAFDEAAEEYVAAGLDPDWFGDEYVSRTTCGQCIPGHE